MQARIVKPMKKVLYLTFSMTVAPKRFPTTWQVIMKTQKTALKKPLFVSLAQSVVYRPWETHNKPVPTPAITAHKQIKKLMKPYMF
jgi:hypothetical protein